MAHPRFVVRLVLDGTEVDESVDQSDAMDFMLFEFEKRPCHSATVLLRGVESPAYVKVIDRGLDPLLQPSSPSLVQWLSESLLWNPTVMQPAHLFTLYHQLFVRPNGCVRLRCDHLGLAVLRLLLDDAQRANYLLLPAWRTIAHIV